MFLGHFGVGFGAKSARTKISLGTLFLAAQLIDLLWPTLLLLGVERVRIDPRAAGGVLVFEHYPVTHSLLAVSLWALLLAATHWLVRRETRGAVVLGLVVLSHWALDALVHRPDLPLYPGDAHPVGLGLWSYPVSSVLLEAVLFVTGAWSYLRCTRPANAVGRWALAGLVAFLVAVSAADRLGPPPPNVAAIAWTGQAQWLLVAWGYWVDRHRRPV